jgi:RimJ/RimL family protein N-acetyltransferase
VERANVIHTTEIRWQPILNGSLIHLRPLAESDFEPLFSAASDPLIWEQHPDRERYKRDRYQIYFNSGMECKGGLAIIEPKTSRVIGSSRFIDHPHASAVEVGYTFLTRECWGKGHNRELKSLMLNYAFQFVETAFFVVGKANYRSRKAMSKLGAAELSEHFSTPLGGDLSKSAIYEIKKTEWQTNAR